MMGYFITPRVTPHLLSLFHEPSICDAFNNSHVQFISDTLHIIRSVFKHQFFSYTLYAKYAFLLLFSILIDFSLNVKVATLIFISGRGLAI